MDQKSLAALIRRFVLVGAAAFSGDCLSPTYNCGAIPQTATIPLMGAGDGGYVAGGDAGAADGGIDDLVARCQAPIADCVPLCQALVPGGPWNFLDCQLVASDGGLVVQADYEYRCLGGRRSEGLRGYEADRARSAVGGWLARTAHLEAASVDAFSILASELEAHRAPLALVRAARAAELDERRHALVMGRLAASRGVTPSPVLIDRRPLRTLEGMSRENGVEGCVRETYAALVAWKQAAAAQDPGIRSAMRSIAADETRHAALAWAVEGWSRSMLPLSGRRRLRDAQIEAGDDLIAESAADLPAPLRREIGWPDSGEAVEIATSLRDVIYGA